MMGDYCWARHMQLLMSNQRNACAGAGSGDIARLHKRCWKTESAAGRVAFRRANGNGACRSSARWGEFCSEPPRL